MAPRETDEAEDAQRRFTASDLIALVAVISTFAIALVSVWASDRQSDKQFERDLIKQDQAELRQVLDAATGTAARVGGDQVVLGTTWLRTRDVSEKRLERNLNDLTEVAARVAVRLDENHPLADALQELNSELVVIRNGVIYDTDKAARSRVLRAATAVPDAIADVWTAAHSVGRSRLLDDGSS